MKKERILWADDEIEFLRPYVLFLEEKGYEVTTTTNGKDAVELCQKETFDIVFLDENMPGLGGLETLAMIKENNFTLPIVMVTKNEEENIMNMAIGSKIADYLIKPVNPSQILLTIKKNIHKKDIIAEHTNTTYQSQFNQIGMQINDTLTYDDWIEVYKKLVYWELELAETHNGMDEMFRMQKMDANNNFIKFIKKNYATWFEHNAQRPFMSHDIFKTKVFPLLDKGEKVFFVVVDNFRYDQWKILQTMMGEFYQITDESIYCSILPTATQYARNAIFSGLLPLQIQEMFPQFWVEEAEEEGKNLFEKDLLQTQFDRFRKKYTFSYHKINDSNSCDRLINNQLSRIDSNQLNVCVLNFIDMLSHAGTESKMLRELTNDAKAYRSLTISWFKHSSIYHLFKAIAERHYTIVFTTDHGSIQVNKPIKIIGDRETNVNLRYKVGKNLSYDKKDVFEVKEPATVGLPSPNINSKYVFACNEDFFVYPNNYGQFVSYFKDTFQHGGISLEEMLLPLVVMKPK